uniref:Uncharacterized protein n=1 Tax=Chromera velia CCMP2878 TaxID=1169474 RepID=A0A0G4G7P6_9ALVE|eukprot:Cvel_20563.t1-p1 / transcript=Cvel_20563.t1 / gene=Cvel_20563 / organism=Chromera_velia_CCMP2878 / gene_product=hypothetical protein / transcript_product=hypothetical protein / location=Cvel_scaffold1856:32711-36631(-) / protein_length=382 / sequence_SO=supercontig / SO=protein_coding / is_pseudo=false
MSDEEDPDPPHIPIGPSPEEWEENNTEPIVIEENNAHPTGENELAVEGRGRGGRSLWGGWSARRRTRGGTRRPVSQGRLEAGGSGSVVTGVRYSRESVSGSGGGFGGCASPGLSLLVSASRSDFAGVAMESGGGERKREAGLGGVLADLGESEGEGKHFRLPWGGWEETQGEEEGTEQREAAGAGSADEVPFLGAPIRLQVGAGGFDGMSDHAGGPPTKKNSTETKKEKNGSGGAAKKTDPTEKKKEENGSDGAAKKTDPTEKKKEKNGSGGAAKKTDPTEKKKKNGSGGAAKKTDPTEKKKEKNGSGGAAKKTDPTEKKKEKNGSGSASSGVHTVGPRVHDSLGVASSSSSSSAPRWEGHACTGSRSGGVPTLASSKKRRV